VTAISRPSSTRPAAADLNRGFSNGMEFAGVVLVFFFAGFGLDKWLDTAPWCTLGLTLFGIVGSFVRAWYAYAAEMDRLQAQRQQSRTVGQPGQRTEGSVA
jgi:F0F1-type ATP synthase assembly protein I